MILHIVEFMQKLASIRLGHSRIPAFVPDSLDIEQSLVARALDGTRGVKRPIDRLDRLPRLILLSVRTDARLPAWAVNPADRPQHVQILAIEIADREKHRERVTIELRSLEILVK